MNNTIDYYNQNARSFVSGTLHADMSQCRSRFLQYVKPGGAILDAGCGSGRDSLIFMQKGYAVSAFDASEEVCRIAGELLGIPVACMRFEDLTGEEKYDGIWACASLLHVRGEDMEDVMQRLARLLKPAGVLYASWKKSAGDNALEREKDGRFFRDMTLADCRALFEKAGMEVLELFETTDVRPGRESEGWVNIIGKKLKTDNLLTIG